MLKIITPSAAPDSRWEFLLALNSDIEELQSQWGVPAQWIIATPSPEKLPHLSAKPDVKTVEQGSSPAQSRSAILFDRDLISDTDYVINIDDDDQFSPELLQSIYRTAKQGNLMVVSGNSLDMDSDTRVFSTWEQLPEGTYDSEEVVRLLRSTDALLTIHPSAVLWNAWLLRGAGGWDTSLPQAEDIDLVLKVASSGVQWHHIALPWHYYRKHSQSMMSSAKVRELDKVLLPQIFDRWGA